MRVDSDYLTYSLGLMRITFYSYLDFNYLGHTYRMGQKMNQLVLVRTPPNFIISGTQIAKTIKLWLRYIHCSPRLIYVNALPC